MDELFRGSLVNKSVPFIPNKGLFLTLVDICQNETCRVNLAYWNLHRSKFTGGNDGYAGNYTVAEPTS
jgi:hypothetical protein